MLASTTAGDAQKQTAPPQRFAATTLSWLRAALPVLSVVALGAAVLVVHSQRYMPFFADDSFISMRYAERLLEGKGLTWNDGERVEGYSNLLWVLALAFVSAFGIDMLTAARALGVACFVVCMGAIAFSCAPTSFRDRRLAAAAVGVLGIALTGIVGVWSIGGLEHPLLAALVSAGSAWTLHNLRSRPEAALTARAWVGPGVLFGLAGWTRPDGALFAATVATTLVCVPSMFRRPARAVAVLLGITAAFGLAQLAFRLGYYGEWVPNTARAKLAWTPQRLKEGWEHVLQGYAGLWPLVLIATSGLWPVLRDAGARLRVLVPLGGAVAWTMYLVVIGGDFFPAWRHFVPVVVLLAFASAEALSWWEQRLKAWFWGAVALTAACLATLLGLQLADPSVKQGIHERWEWQAPPIGALLRRQFGEKAPLFAVDSAGCLPWFSKLPALDMLGLNDHYLAHHPPPDLGTRDLGHELGDGAYVLSRQPDLVLFGIPSDHGRPKFRGGFEMFNTRTFRDAYDKVVFRAGSEGLLYRTWMRRPSPKVGISHSESRVSVPGYFFAASDDTPAIEGADGRLGVYVAQNRSVTQRVWLNRGIWHAELEASGAKVRLRLQGSGVSGRRSEWQIEAPTEVRIKITGPERGSAIVHRLVLERMKTNVSRLPQHSGKSLRPTKGRGFDL
ncbi:MAG TPA: hypothetical protein VI197_06695 [Polyangiaceae bacterium]